MKRPGHYFPICLLTLISGITLADDPDATRVEKLTIAAHDGDAESQFELGIAYDNGYDVTADGQMALLYYRMAAEQGHAEAQNSVGRGMQAEERYTEALHWYEKAAAQGHDYGTHNLAYLYDLGLGVWEDNERALELYRRSADAGLPDSMWNMALLYGNGKLGEENLDSACIWAVRALSYANPDDPDTALQFEDTVTKLQETLSEERMQVCKETADTWKPPEPKTFPLE